MPRCRQRRHELATVLRITALGTWPVVMKRSQSLNISRMYFETSATSGASIDGASNQCTFHESANLSAIRKLPVIFVCENNQYAESTPVWYSTAARTIADRARGYDIPGVVVDGQDVFAVYEAASEAVRRARAGEGPTLIECKTYRHFGHFEGDTQKYKHESDVDLYMGNRDPIAVFKATVLELGLLTETEAGAGALAPDGNAPGPGSG